MAHVAVVRGPVATAARLLALSGYDAQGQQRKGDKYGSTAWSTRRRQSGCLFDCSGRDRSKKLKVHGSPWQFSETPARIGIAPELGEHNVPILTHLGYTEVQIQELEEKNVI
jgi:hypothetical protein